MSTISTILEPDEDGTLHLPLPPELRGGKVRIEATLAPVEPVPVMTKPTRARLTATPEMLAQRRAAGEKLRKLNPFRHLADPAAWQREVRADVTLPGRE